MLKSKSMTGIASTLAILFFMNASYGMDDALSDSEGSFTSAASRHSSLESLVSIKSGDAPDTPLMASGYLDLSVSSSDSEDEAIWEAPAASSAIVPKIPATWARESTSLDSSPITPASHLRRQAEALDQMRLEEPHIYDEYARAFKKLETRDYLPWLSFTGGGVRGIIGAKMLAIFEEKTGKRARELFPFMAGTSTGGLLAALFKLGIPGVEAVEMYKQYATSIFESRYYFNPSGIRGPKYNIENLKNVIREYVGDQHLADVEGDLLITAYNASRMRTHIFKSWDARENPRDPKRNPLLVDLLAATAAAPTYFDPVIIDGEAYVDGGLFANDPAACAYAEIKRRYGKINHMAVLLGTGKVDHGFKDPEDLLGRGTISQVKDIIDYAISANLDTARYIVSQMLPNIGSFQQLYVIDPVVANEVASLDCTDPSVLRRLELYADDFIEAEKGKPWMRKFVRVLIEKQEAKKIASPRKIRDFNASLTGVGYRRA